MFPSIPNTFYDKKMFARFYFLDNRAKRVKYFLTSFMKKLKTVTLL